MHTLIAGADGQLGAELKLQRRGRLTALEFSDLDITDRDAVVAAVEQYRPTVIINAAAYTAVDAAESNRDAAFAVNATGAGNLAEAAVACGARLLHVSTDFVFDGASTTPYAPGAAVAPPGVYGESKAAGEKLVTSIAGEAATTVRTSWLYSAYGANFVMTMLRLMKERTTLSVVADQVGSPTHARSLAELLWTLSEDEGCDTQLLHWANAGVASWYDFAVAIHDEGRRLGLLSRDTEITPIRTAEYPTPARRPAYSVLDTRASNAWLTPRHWRHELVDMLTILAGK